MKKINFSRNVAILRKRRYMTQEALAEKCGVSRQAVTKWEAGNYPDIALLPTICEVFNVTTDELLFGSFEDDYISSDKQEIFKRYEEMISIIQMQVTGLSDIAAKLYKRYKENSNLELFEREEPNEVNIYHALDLAAKGEYQEAIEELEEELIAGNISAFTPLIEIYNEIRRYTFFEEEEDEIFSCEKVYAAKLEVYGKIYREELEKTYP
jgi:transcriptional regulator with XRE-family HTH domain